MLQRHRCQSYLSPQTVINKRNWKERRSRSERNFPQILIPKVSPSRTVSYQPWRKLIRQFRPEGSEMRKMWWSVKCGSGIKIYQQVAMKVSEEFYKVIRPVIMIINSILDNALSHRHLNNSWDKIESNYSYIHLNVHQLSRWNAYKRFTS